jgi:hypothetical protein
MVNANLLKSKIVLHGDTLASLAEHLGIARQTLTSKMSGTTDFTQSEIKQIILKYDLTLEETNEIFFGESDES